MQAVTTEDAPASDRRPTVVDHAPTPLTGKVVGRFMASDGRAVGGSIVFTPSTRVVLEGVVHVKSPITVELDDSGSLGKGVDLFASDVVGGTHTGFTWAVSCRGLRLDGKAVQQPDRVIAVLAGRTLDLADVVDVPASGGTISVVDPIVASRAEAAADRAEAILEDLVGAGGLTLASIRTELLEPHVNDTTPHPAYDDAPSFVLAFENGLA